MKAIVFPGQGAQHKGMGADVFDSFPDMVAEADELLGYSIRDFCMNSTEQELSNTKYSQPVMYTINTMFYHELMDKTGQFPDYLAGHSLGEYNALLAAEVFDFQTGLKIVKKRGELMASEDSYGMAAVLGLSSEETETIIKDNNLTDLFIANYNTHIQQVISGPITSLKDAEEIFYDNYALKYVILKVSGAFHSPYMNGASSQFKQFLSEIEFKVPKIPVIANVTTKPHKLDGIVPNLSSHINSPVKWFESIVYLKQKGVKKFMEPGNSTVLNDMIKHIDA